MSLSIFLKKSWNLAGFRVVHTALFTPSQVSVRIHVEYVPQHTPWQSRRASIDNNRADVVLCGLSLLHFPNIHSFCARHRSLPNGLPHYHRLHYNERWHQCIDKGGFTRHYWTSFTVSIWILCKKKGTQTNAVTELPCPRWTRTEQTQSYLDYVSFFFRAHALFVHDRKALT